ncbi:MFS transporter [candidate division KSB1 bacterium]|nr:MFS transporter [candidate division KSB1 bacterium]
MDQKKSTGLLRSFPRVFWIANLMELFERAAYYGLNSVLAVYLTNEMSKGGLGFSEESVGFLQSLVYAITYIVPILGGAFADRYGYRRMLLIAFSLLSAGYFISGHVSSYGIIFAGLLIMATGSGLFKPIISGTLARSTDESNSGFGFGIYYWMINLGAFLSPIFVTFLKGFSWSYVFIASSLYCLLMLIPAVFLYRDPPKPKSTKKMRQVLSGAAMVLGDARFMLMIFVYSCFWILYFQNFGSVLWFMRDFVDKTPVNNFLEMLGIPPKFDVEHVTAINAGTIILLQVFVSRIVKNIKALPTMVSGIFIGSMGFVVLAFAHNAWIFVLGIAVFSIGEMTTHPKYYSYIGLVAPSDKKAVYMGYGFLYGVIGTLVGSNLGGILYESMLKPLVGKPDVTGDIRLFWLIFALLGIMSMLALVLYNRFFSEETEKTNAAARKIMIGVYTLLIVLGVVFLYQTLFQAESVQYKTIVQSLIMLLVGSGGIYISFQKREESD